MKLKYKHIEASREVRLWIGQVIIPACATTVAILSIPGVKESISEKIASKREAVKSKFKKN